MPKIAVIAGWSDVPHLPQDVQDSLLLSIPPWQRDSRSKGIPQLGSGGVYTTPISEIEVPGFEIPPHYVKCYGMDVGWNRTAALWGAYDRESGTLYIYDEYYRGQAEPSVHAAAILQRGKWIPGVIDPASRGRMQTDGAQLLGLYQDLGLDLEVADNGREAGIYKVWEMLSQGRFKVFRSCTSFFNEYRIYRRDERGQIVKKNDHLMDAGRYLVMSGLERAKVEPSFTGTPWFHWNPPNFWSG